MVPVLPTPALQWIRTGQLGFSSLDLIITSTSSMMFGNSLSSGMPKSGHPKAYLLVHHIMLFLKTKERRNYLLPPIILLKDNIERYQLFTWYCLTVFLFPELRLVSSNSLMITRVFFWVWLINLTL